MFISSKKALNHINPTSGSGILAGHSSFPDGRGEWTGLRPDLWNLLQVLDGGCRVWNGETVHLLQGGGFFLLAPCSRRRFERVGRWDARWIMFRPDLTPTWPEAGAGIFRVLPDRGEKRRMERNLTEIIRLAYAGGEGWHLLACNLIDNILLRGNLCQNGGGDVDRRWLKAVRLLGRIGDALSMDEIAAGCGMSRAAFFAGFRLRYGCSPRRYREQLRLRAARVLLESGELPVGEIALRTGLADGGYLTRRFRRYFGMTPLEYRRRIREASISFPG